VLIIPSFEDLEMWAREHSVHYSSRRDLVRARQVQKLYEGIVAELNINLAQFEKLKKVLVVPDELSIADGTLTPSMKLRRRNLTDLYKKEIDALYAEAESQPRTNTLQR
jgi:long-chain acyl-CoA synthetase